MIFRKPGDSIVLEASFIDNGVLFNPYQVRAVAVYDPTGTLMSTLTPTHVIDGEYSAAYTIPAHGTPGIWTHRWYWTALAGMAELTQYYHFSVESVSSAGALNKSALDQTISYFDAKKDDLIWMVCTGGSVTPTLQVIFNLVTKAWRTKTMTGTALAMDTLNASCPNVELMIGGDENGKLFYFDLADADLSADISCTLETGDKRPGQEIGVVYAFQDAHLNAKATGAGQLLHFDWFTDEAAVESFSGGVDFTLTIDSVTYRTDLNGSGEKIRARFYNSDQVGPITLNLWDFGFVPVRRR